MGDTKLSFSASLESMTVGPSGQLGLAFEFQIDIFKIGEETFRSRVSKFDARVRGII